MDTTEKSIRRNKTIITVFVLTIVFAAFSYIMLHSTPNSEVCFRHIYNQRTGEPASVLLSILCYLFFWCVISIFSTGIVDALTMNLYWILHLKDKNIFDRFYHPKYECEIEYGIRLAWIACSIAVLVLILLHASNIISIHIV